MVRLVLSYQHGGIWVDIMIFKGKCNNIIHQSTNMRCLHLSLRWIYWVFVAYIHGYQKGQENISLHCFHPIIIHYMMNQWSFKI